MLYVFFYHGLSSTNPTLDRPFPAREQSVKLQPKRLLARESRDRPGGS
jgi:hypothetical protein